MASTLINNEVSLHITNGEFLGGKSGYTEDAGLCLASLAIVNGTKYIFVSGNAKGDHTTSPYHIMEAIHVYEKLS